MITAVEKITKAEEAEEKKPEENSTSKGSDFTSPFFQERPTGTGSNSFC